MRKLALISIFTFLFMFLALPSANAYVDPASGSLAIQIIVGALAAIGAGFVAFRRKIGMFFGKLFRRDRAKV